MTRIRRLAAAALAAFSVLATGPQTSLPVLGEPPAVAQGHSWCC